SQWRRSAPSPPASLASCPPPSPHVTASYACAPTPLAWPVPWTRAPPVRRPWTAPTSSRAACLFHPLPALAPLRARPRTQAPQRLLVYASSFSPRSGISCIHWTERCPRMSGFIHHASVPAADQSTLTPSIRLIRTTSNCPAIDTAGPDYVKMSACYVSSRNGPGHRWHLPWGYADLLHGAARHAVGRRSRPGLCHRCTRVPEPGTAHDAGCRAGRRDALRHGASTGPALAMAGCCHAVRVRRCRTAQRRAIRYNPCRVPPLVRDAAARALHPQPDGRPRRTHGLAAAARRPTACPIPPDRARGGSRPPPRRGCQ